MFLRNFYTSPHIQTQIELRLTPEETECVQVALQLLHDDLREMPPYCRDQDIRRGIQIIGGVLERLDRMLGKEEADEA